MSASPEVVYRAVHTDADTRLFTIMLLDRANGLGQRVYTSHPAEYPASGAKPLFENRWFRQVILRHQSFIANATHEFSDVFGDYDIINELGCHSAMNIPIVDGNTVIGTVNFLDVSDYFSSTVIAGLEQLVERHRPALIHAMSR